jgi:predicted transcriptional regulator
MTLKQARELVGINQSELARTAGVTKFVVSDLERGRLKYPNVAYGTIVKIVRGLQRHGLPGLQLEAVFPIEDEAA